MHLHNPASNKQAGIARNPNGEWVDSESAPPVLMAEGELRVVSAVVLFRGLPVVETELETAALVIIKLEDVVGCAVGVLSDFIEEEAVAIVIMEIVCKSALLVELEPLELPNPLQMKATATTPAKDSHVSSLLYGTLVFSFEQALSPYVAQSAYVPFSQVGRRVMR